MTINEQIVLYTQDGKVIENWENWTRPKKEYQWAEGRSAMELAKSWFRGSICIPPNEFSNLFQESGKLTDVVIRKGIPEFVTSLPERGEGRNHDLWLLANSEQGQITICVEAKADEPFGNKTVSEYRQSSEKLRAEGGSTRVPERIQKLLSMVTHEPENWSNIRYQLLTAICGTILQVKRDNSDLGVFLVHEFRTSNTVKENLEENQREYIAFLSVLSGSGVMDEMETLQGPFELSGVRCLVGKIVTQF